MAPDIESLRQFLAHLRQRRINRRLNSFDTRDQTNPLVRPNDSIQRFFRDHHLEWTEQG
jgi:hypothetical protein